MTIVERTDGRDAAAARIQPCGRPLRNHGASHIPRAAAKAVSAPGSVQHPPNLGHSLRRMPLLCHVAPSSATT